MTRLEPLIVTALGRSPYDDEVLYNEETDLVPGTVRTGQQYDIRGRPMNRETLQQSRNLVRASNEVLAAAGIIESEEGFKARDAAKVKQRDAREEDIQKAYRRRAYGQIALTCGVWGACGLRRRIELYKDYSNHPLIELIRRERQTSSLLRIFGAGLPALMLNRAIGNVAHFININPFSPTTKTIVTHVTNYIMFHYKYFAILQQLGLMPSSFPHFIVPPLSFMVPFSSTSPFYLPTLPATWTTSTTLEFASKAALVAAPILFLQLWYRISNHIISEIYDPVYSILPHASNLAAAEKLEREAAAAAAAIIAQAQPSHSRSWTRANAPSPENELVVINEDDVSDTSSDGNSTTTWNEDDYASLPPRPSNPTPTSDPTTLRALEGRDHDHDADSENNLRGGATVHDSHPHHDHHHRPSRRYSYASTQSSDVEATTTTLITFDVEASDEPLGTGSAEYSAELRQATPAHETGLRGGGLGGEGDVPLYDVTASSIMPAHLFADGVTVLASTGCTVVLEMMMVRSVAASWLGRGKGGGSWSGGEGTWGVWMGWGWRLPWGGWGNIGLVFMGDLVMTSVIWGGCMVVMRACDWVEKKWAEANEAKEEMDGVKVHED